MNVGLKIDARPTEDPLTLAPLVEKAGFNASVRDDLVCPRDLTQGWSRHRPGLRQ